MRSGCSGYHGKSSASGLQEQDEVGTGAVGALDDEGVAQTLADGVLGDVCEWDVLVCAMVFAGEEQ